MLIRTTHFSRRRAIQYLSTVVIAGATDRASAEHESRFPLWEIYSKHRKVFLLGHTPPREADWKESHIEDLLRRCGHFWNETNHSVRSSVQEVIQAYGTAPNQSLEERLEAPQRTRLSEAAKITGVPAESLKHFRPWLAGQTLEGAFFGASPFNKQNTDAVLAAEARSLSIPVSSEFPTLDDAARWFFELSPAAEVQYLLYVIDEILVGHEEGQKVYTQWAIGNDLLATKWVARMAQKYPQLYRSIVVERNQGWVPRVQAMMQAEQPTMVVVGFYHLVGPDSIQRQLENHGFRLRRT
ncbi:MAG: TraB/GumN family protein [Steroidobacteraceae bacterium]